MNIFAQINSQFNISFANLQSMYDFVLAYYFSSLSFMEISYQFTIFCAILYQSSIFSWHSFQFTILFVNLLSIHYLFYGSSINSLSFKGNQFKDSYQLTIFFLNLISIHHLLRDSFSTIQVQIYLCKMSHYNQIQSAAKK